MKKLVAIVSIVLLGAVAHAQPTVSDPNIEVREAKDFHGISVSSAFDVLLTQANEEKVAVSASEQKYLAHIKVEVKNGVLHIGWDNKGMKWTKGNKKLKAYISFKNIDKLKASGACNLSIVGDLKADELLVDLSGASDLKGKIEAKELVFDISGASDTRITGSTVSLSVDASGASSFKAFGLSTDYCNVKASGASAIKITVNKELSATASGASDIDYKGEGLIRDIKTSGASSVSRS
ncbi:MAG TPA: head GIN domain-containing protein [Chitinophagaceae bacterium]